MPKPDKKVPRYQQDQAKFTKTVPQPRLSVQTLSKKVGGIDEPIRHDRLNGWQFGRLVINGASDFCWTACKAPQDFQMVLKRFSEFEGKNLSELKHQGSHKIPVENLSLRAKAALKAIKLDDIDEIFSFRLEGRPRMHGLWRQGVVHVLWWDPDHEVCPSQKK